MLVISNVSHFIVRILLFVIFFLLSPALATAGSCESKHSEKFEVFFDKFSTEKEFAVGRTLYPLRLRLWEYGLDEKGNDASSPILKFVTKAQDQNKPSLSSYIQENSLDFKITQNLQKSAKVHIFKEGTDLSVIYLFVNKNRCWFLREIEDRSL